MSAAPLPEPVRLFDSPESPNGRRYTDADREAAFQCWRTVGGRSLRRVAEITGVALSTVAGWSTRDGWVERGPNDRGIAVGDIAYPHPGGMYGVIAIVLDWETGRVRVVGSREEGR